MRPPGFVHQNFRYALEPLHARPTTSPQRLGISGRGSQARPTGAYDRGEKFAHYRRLPSLREYVLVSQREARLEAFYKNDDGAWVLDEAGSGQVLTLRSLTNVRLDVDGIYRDPLAG
jgi:hypothetical protein